VVRSEALPAIVAHGSERHVKPYDNGGNRTFAAAIAVVV